MTLEIAGKTSSVTFATNMEHAGDVIDRNLLNIGNKMVKRGVTFSKPGQVELLAMIDRLIANTKSTASLFMTGDERAARLLAKEKEVFRTMESTATDAHFQRLRAGHVETVETSTLHLDALRDLKSVNPNLVAAAAYPCWSAMATCFRRGFGNKAMPNGWTARIPHSRTGLPACRSAPVCLA